MFQTIILRIFILQTVLFAVTLVYGQKTDAQHSGYWFIDKSDSLIGVNYEKVNELINNTNTNPRKEVIVAVIDAGFDFTHPRLSNLAWKNSKEKPGNGVDDDRNGYIDDMSGWNFLGNSKGENIVKVGTEAFREYKRLRRIYANADSSSLQPAQQQEYAYFKKMAAEAGIDKYIVYEKRLALIADMYTVCDSLMSAHYHSKPTTINDFYHIEVKDTTGLMPVLNSVATLTLAYPKEKKWADVVAENIDKYQLAHKRIESLDDFNDDPHGKIGNSPDLFSELHYGNNQIDIDAYHGTMVAGLVALAASEGKAKISIMGIRAIPDGDEYDKDVASAIRYAVNNGAKIINMSFGKKISPHRAEVEAAMKYARSKDVLFIKAAGNEGFNTDITPLYPSPLKEDATKRDNMIVVGASTKEGTLSKFSCYGKQSVDLLAPGDEIRSTSPDGGYDTQVGTSLSAPIVAGIAAVIRSYFPDLSAKEVKDILLNAVTDVAHKETLLPGKEKRVTTVAETCATGGIIDAFQAFKEANEKSRYRVKKIVK